MDLSFLANPVNTAITSFTILSVLGGVVYTLRKRNVSISKDGLIIKDEDKEMNSRVPAFDYKCKAIMREVVYSYERVILGMLTIQDRVQQALFLIGFRETLRRHIENNHLTKWFSDEDKYKEWVDGIVIETLAYIKYVDNYCGLSLGDSVEEDVRKVMDMLRGPLTTPVEDMIENKIGYYSSLPKSDKTTELIERNEKYLRLIKGRILK